MSSCDDWFDFRGKVALVTGASSGLGEHFVRVLHGRGTKVIALARRVGRLQALKKEIDSVDASIDICACDVTDSQSVQKTFAELQSRQCIPHMVINCAGVAVSKPFVDQTESDWDQVLDTNLKGAWLVSQEAAKLMIASNQAGSITNIASIIGLRVAGAIAPYAASKAALIHLTKSLALELAKHQIRVNALCPGYIQTDLNQAFLASAAGQKLLQRIPQKRFGSLKDLEGPLLLLCSDASAFMTGSVVAVDGGHLVNSL